MSTVLPQSKGLKRAVKWISDHLKSDQDQDMFRLINDAILHFDLSPKEGQFLINFYKQTEPT